MRRISETVSLAWFTASERPDHDVVDDVADHEEAGHRARGPRPGDVGGDPDVVGGDLEVDLEAGAAGDLDDPLQQERRDVLAGHPLGLAERLGERGVVDGGVELTLGGQRVGDQDPGTAPERVVGGHHLGDGRAVGDRPVERLAGRGEPEAGELVGAVADHGHAQRLEPLEGGGDVEDRLHARGDDGDRHLGQHGEVRGLVVRLATRRGGRRRAHRWRRPGRPRAPR